MVLLVAGLLLWSLVHLSPALKPSLRSNLVQSIGEGPYKGLFAVVIIGALYLMIQGWKSIEPTVYYQIGHPAVLGILQLLVIIGLVLFFSSRYPNRIKRTIRHPQLTGVKIWATAHLIMNGDSRSLVLFGGILAWAVLEVIFINRRQREWVKPAPAKLGIELTGLVISLLVIGLIVHFHQYLAGVKII